ncbi:MAG: cupin domain-containing protein [Marinilabiliales bacterium]|nr:cupin domain-containing protein [Marinilabiliales bacterium]
MRTLFLLILFAWAFAGSVSGQYNAGIRIEQILKTDTTSLGQKFTYPSGGENEVTLLKITIPKGMDTGWHHHDRPVFAYVLKGTLTVEFENGKILEFKENSSFSEVIHTLHRGLNKGPGELVLLAIYLGEKGKPLSIRKSEP